MACPYAFPGDSVLDDAIPELQSGSQDGMNNLAITEGVNYNTYLALDKVLSSQNCLSIQKDGTPVHDEHLFIITHQAYELWFKQIMYETDSVRNILDNERVDERRMLIISTRLNRVNLILKLLCDQFSILETMTPLDFASFREFLGSSSGFQSLQFRLLENTLGIRDENRVRYNQQYYKDVFNDPLNITLLDKSVSEPSLLELIERWLERTPGLGKDEFHFWNKYRSATAGYIRNEFEIPAENEVDPQLRKLKFEEHNKLRDAFDTILDEEKYNKLKSRGERRLSHTAFQGAMMIFLYRDEPRFHQPFHMLTMLQDLDSHFTKWRYNHVMLVQRMIGSKLGTGGSSGYQYLRSTVSDRYKVFIDLFNLSTYMIPRSYIPPLTSRMKKSLSIMLKPDSTLYNVSSTEYEDEAPDINGLTISESDDKGSADVGFTVGSVE